MSAPSDKVSRSASIARSAKEYKSQCWLENGQFNRKGIEALSKYTKEEIDNLNEWAAKDHPHALFDLATCYRFGDNKNVPKNLLEALKLVEKAEKKDFRLAKWAIGEFYLYPELSPQLKISEEERQKKALNMFTAVAMNGLWEGQYSLAELLRQQKNLSEAFRWYEIAANSGLVAAQIAVAYSYENNIGIPSMKLVIRTQKAIEFYKRAALQGSEAAKKELDRLAPMPTFPRSAAKTLESSPKTESENKLGKEAALRQRKMLPKIKQHGQKKKIGSRDDQVLNNGQESKEAKEISEETLHPAWVSPLTSSYVSAFKHSNAWDLLKGLEILQQIPQERFSELEALAFDDNAKPDIMNDLGTCYRYGYGLARPDGKAAFTQISKAVEKNFAIALYAKAELYYSNFGIPEAELKERVELAFTWFRNAKQHGISIDHAHQVRTLHDHYKSIAFPFESVSYEDINILIYHIKEAIAEGSLTQKHLADFQGSPLCQVVTKSSTQLVSLDLPSAAGSAGSGSSAAAAAPSRFPAGSPSRNSGASSSAAIELELFPMLNNTSKLSIATHDSQNGKSPSTALKVLLSPPNGSSVLPLMAITAASAPSKPSSATVLFSPQGAINAGSRSFGENFGQAAESKSLDETMLLIDKLNQNNDQIKITQDESQKLQKELSDLHIKINSAIKFIREKYQLYLAAQKEMLLLQPENGQYAENSGFKGGPQHKPMDCSTDEQQSLHAARPQSSVSSEKILKYGFVPQPEGNTILENLRSIYTSEQYTQTTAKELQTVLASQVAVQKQIIGKLNALSKNLVKKIMELKRQILDFKSTKLLSKPKDSKSEGAGVLLFGQTKATEGQTLAGAGTKHRLAPSDQEQNPGPAKKGKHDHPPQTSGDGNNPIDLTGKP